MLGLGFQEQDENLLFKERKYGNRRAQGTLHGSKKVKTKKCEAKVLVEAS